MAKQKETIFSIIGGIIFLIVFIPFVWNNPEVVDDVQHAITEICGIDKKLFDAFDDSVFETLDQKGRQIYNSFLMGNEVTKCDAWYFYQQLDEKNRNKIKLKEFACNVNDCTKGN